jgi:hypothetical protein
MKRESRAQIFLTSALLDAAGGTCIFPAVQALAVLAGAYAFKGTDVRVKSVASKEGLLENEKLTFHG